MKFYSFILFFFMSHSVFAQKTLDDVLNKYNTRSVPYISVEELKILQSNSTIALLDSREINEYNVSHIQGATFVGFNEFSAAKISEEIINKETPIVVYCSLGIRSEEVGEKLKKAGFTNVKNLYGGIFQWKNKEYPILNNKQQKTDSVHTFSKSWSKWLDNGVKVY